MRCCGALLIALCALFAVPHSHASLMIGYVGFGPLEVTMVEDFSQIPSVTKAWGFFNDTVDTLGWATLEIHAGGTLSDSMDLEAAGFLEGYLTAPRIAQNFRNRWNITAWSSNPALMDFVQKNILFMQSRFIDPPVGEEAYWRQVGLVQTQIEGLANGYLAGKLGTDAAYTTMDFLLANMHDDVDDVLTALQSTDELGSTREPRFDAGEGGCSAFVRVVPDDLYTSQITWTTYQTMLRVFKKYAFSVTETDAQNSSLVPATRLSFGGYFGLVACGDDYYQMNPSLLVTQETTNDVGDTSLFRKYTTPETVYEYIRALVANRLATSAADWVDIFSLYNSGTYNNQWMAVDYGLLQNHFDQGHDTSTLPDGLLWVAEQIPGTIASADVTPTLRANGYWASYNIPYFPEIYNVSGYPQWFAQYGDFYSYSNCPRAKIFARDGPKVQTMEDMQRLMRYNRFQTDPFSKCACSPPYSAENAIASRSDLNPANGTYPFSALGHRCRGATDAKMTNLKWVVNATTLAIVGPTYDDQPPFQWSTSDFDSVPHEGLPDRFEFDWQLISWIPFQPS